MKMLRVFFITVAMLGLVGGVFAKPTVKQIELTWTAAIDPEPGSGISHYRVYRDFELIADNVMALRFVDVVRNGTYVYGVTAVDRAGHESEPAEIKIRVRPNKGKGRK